MAEYIDRQALGVGKCNLDVSENKEFAKGWNAAIDIIQEAPAADVHEVKHGEKERKIKMIIKHLYFERKRNEQR